MLRRLPSDAVLLVLALSTIAFTIGATLLLHTLLVGDDVATAVRVATDVAR